MKYTIFSTFGNFQTNKVLSSTALRNMASTTASIRIPNIKLSLVNFDFQNHKDLYTPFFNVIGCYEHDKNLMKELYTIDEFHLFIGKHIRDNLEQKYFFNFKIFNMKTHIITHSKTNFNDEIRVYTEGKLI